MATLYTFLIYYDITILGYVSMRCGSVIHESEMEKPVKEYHFCKEEK